MTLGAGFPLWLSTPPMSSGRYVMKATSETVMARVEVAKQFRHAQRPAWSYPCLQPCRIVSEKTLENVRAIRAIQPSRRRDGAVVGPLVEITSARR
jgi:hypothetical protein